MTTLFVSDLHLDASRPEVTENFLEFLRAAAEESTTLYILGDLFEAWLGDDDADPHGRAVIGGLQRYTASGGRCFLMRGNRDFLIGERFCEATGTTLLPETAVVDLYGRPTLILHGDELCTDDLEYQRFRRFVRHPSFRAFSDSMPMVIRRFVGNRMRSASRTRAPLKPESITDVNQASVEQAMRANGVTTLVHGHTHRPGVHRFALDGAEATRIVLGDWYTQGSVLTWDETGFRLSARPYP